MIKVAVSKNQLPELVWRTAQPSDRPEDSCLLTRVAGVDQCQPVVALDKERVRHPQRDDVDTFNHPLHSHRQMPLALLTVKDINANEILARLVAGIRHAMPATLACRSLMHGIVTQEARLPGDLIVAECRFFGYLGVAPADLAAYPKTCGLTGLRGQRCRQMDQPW
jgi:hypothetical protein